MSQRTLEASIAINIVPLRQVPHDLRPSTQPRFWQRPKPGRQPGQKHGREPEPPSVTDSEFEVRFQQALEKVTALVMNLPLGEVGSTTPGTFGAIEYTLANQITELTERAIRLETRAA